MSARKPPQLRPIVVVPDEVHRLFDPTDNPDATANVDVRPIGWCYRCHDNHDTEARCWDYGRPRTADSIAWTAYCRALDVIVDSGDPRKASPEVLDALAHWATNQAKRNRERTG